MRVKITILGLDIGGANIKAADETGHAVQRAFPIWRESERLTDVLASMFSIFPTTDRIALTMTAELADCFSTKCEGVRFILDAVRAAFVRFTAEHPSLGNSIPTSQPCGIDVWSTDGVFIAPRDAQDHVRKVAAANWHALSTFCGRIVPTGASLLIDIGTTTTDIIPLVDGRPVPIGITDVGRLQSGELSYSGVWRTPICAMAHSVPFRDGYCSLAAELFATMLDVYLLLNEIPEDELNLDTANGKPAIKAAAHDRIARMLCCDRHEVTFEEAVEIAKFLADVQRQRLMGSLERVVRRLPTKCESVILSGSGTFLARRIAYENRHTAESKIILLSELLSPAIAESACAYAVAKLAKEGNSNVVRK